jgi:hypothetical protein
MALDLKNLSRIASLGVPTGLAGDQKHRSKWGLCTIDDAAAVQAAGYFNAAAAMFVKGDLIAATLDVDATPVAKNYVVTAIAAGVVTVALQTTT